MTQKEHNIGDLCPELRTKVLKISRNLIKHPERNIQIWGSIFLECIKQDISFLHLIDELEEYLEFIRGEVYHRNGLVETSELIINYAASELNTSTDKLLRTEKELAREYEQLIDIGCLKDVDLVQGHINVSYEIDIGRYDFRDSEKIVPGLSPIEVALEREYDNDISDYIYTLVLESSKFSPDCLLVADQNGGAAFYKFILLQESNGLLREMFEEKINDDWTEPKLCREIEGKDIPVCERFIKELIALTKDHRLEWKRIFRKNDINGITHLKKDEEYHVYKSGIVKSGIEQRIELIYHKIRNDENQIMEFAYFYRESKGMLTWRYGLKYSDTKYYSIARKYWIGEDADSGKEYVEPDAILMVLRELIEEDIVYKNGLEDKRTKESDPNMAFSNTEGIIEIDYEDIICQTNIMKCRNSGHELVDFTVLIPILTYGELEERKVQIYKSYAGFCKECNMYFMFSSDLQKMLEVGAPLCRVIQRQDELSKSTEDNVFRYKSQSVLNQLGYNVQQEKNLSSSERQEILTTALEKGMIRLADTLDFLNWLVRTRETQKKYRIAVQRWKDDIAFLQKYKELPV